MKVPEENYKLIDEAINQDIMVKINKIVNQFIVSIENIEDGGKYLSKISVAPTIEAFMHDRKDGTLERHDFEQFLYDLVYVNYGEDMFKQEMNKLVKCTNNTTSK
jgi:hypothetical protein